MLQIRGLGLHPQDIFVTSNGLECYITKDLKILQVTSTLAFWGQAPEAWSAQMQIVLTTRYIEMRLKKTEKAWVGGLSCIQMSITLESPMIIITSDMIAIGLTSY